MLRNFCVNLGTVSQLLPELIPSPTDLPEADLPVQLLPINLGVRREREGVVRRKKFVIVYNRSETKAKLHKVSEGGCYWARIELNNVQEFDTVDESMYNSRCGDCFKKKQVDPKQVLEDESSTSSNTD